MSRRFRRINKRVRLAGLTTAGMAAALLGVGDPAAARPRSLSFAQAQQTEQAVEPLAPAQRDQLLPAQRPGGVSREQATSMAQSRYPGRVVRAETVTMGDRVIHEIRILGEDGRVRDFRIDAQTGSFL